MDRETILKRKNELEGLRGEYEASFHKIVGAIEDCEYWLLKIAGATDDNADAYERLGISQEDQEVKDGE